MSQVKFIQLGTVSEPKKNYEVNGSNEYSTLLNQAIQDHPGAVIFTTFIKSATGKPKNEIYANGQLYSAGGSGSGAVYYGTVNVGTDGQIENFSKDHDGAEPEVGNVYIYDPKDTSTGTINASNGDQDKTKGGYIADCTAYYYNGSKWVAFTGNVNAENVWFPDGVQRTAGWGIKNATTNNTVTTECKNNNLKQLLEYYLVQEVWPTPSIGHSQVPNFSVTAGDVSIAESDLTLTYNQSKTVKVTYTAPTTTSVATSYTPQSYISKMTYGYKESLTGDKNPSDSKTVQSNIVYSTVSNPAQGDIKVGIKKGDTIDDTNCNTATPSAQITKVEYTYTVPTDAITSNSGITVTFISGGTYADNFKCSWKDAKNNKVTQVTCPSISSIYYLSNKGAADEDHTKSISEQLQTLPTTPSHSHNTISLNYKVGYPVYLRYKSNANSSWTYTTAKTYYSNNKDFSWTLPQMIDKGTYQLSQILIPDLKNVSINSTGKLWVNNQSNNNYLYDGKSTDTYNGLTYKIITFKSTMACAQGASLKIQLN